MAPLNDRVAPFDAGPAESLDHSTIATRAEACRKLLSQCSDSLRGYKEGDKRWITLRNLSEKFNIWALNMGVFAALHDSLDYRLRDLDEVEQLIREQMDYICRGMNRRQNKFFPFSMPTRIFYGMANAMLPVNTILDDSKPSTDPTSDTAPVYGLQSQPTGHDKIDAILSSLSSCLDWLHRLTILISLDGFSRRNARAFAFPLKDALGNDATPVLEQLFYHRITRDFPTIAGKLRDRLISTMLLRHRRILYRRSRQAKLVPLTPGPALRPAQSNRLPGPALASRHTVLEKMPRQSTAVLSGVASSRYTPTTGEPEASRHVVSTPSRVSKACSIAMTSGNEDLIPKLPHETLSGSDFVCPYCCFILPVAIGRDRNAWTAHVMKDLDPYVCTFFPCAYGEDIFSTSTDWLSHEQSHSMRWYCAAKKHKSDIFVSQDDFISHMKAKHPGTFEDELLPLLADHSKHPSKRIFDACPFCGEVGVEQGSSLEDHVAHHLQYLALLSLPLPDGLDQQEVAQCVSSTEPRGEDVVAASRTTVKSEHSMPPATFSQDDQSPLDAAQTVDVAIPDLDEQRHIPIAQMYHVAGRTQEYTARRRSANHRKRAV